MAARVWCGLVTAYCTDQAGWRELREVDGPLTNLERMYYNRRMGPGAVGVLTQWVESR